VGGGPGTCSELDRAHPIRYPTAGDESTLSAQGGSFALPSRASPSIRGYFESPCQWSTMDFIPSLADALTVLDGPPQILDGHHAIPPLGSSVGTPSTNLIFRTGTAR